MTGHLEWMDSALCAQIDPELFFPVLGEDANPIKKICRTCPVIAECEEWTAAGPQVRQGVWAGKTERHYRGRGKRTRTEPDPRIAFMVKRGWTLGEIGRELNLSDDAVFQRMKRAKI